MLRRLLPCFALTGLLACGDTEPQRDDDAAATDSDSGDVASDAGDAGDVGDLDAEDAPPDVPDTSDVSSDGDDTAFDDALDTDTDSGDLPDSAEVSDTSDADADSADADSADADVGAVDATDASDADAPFDPDACPYPAADEPLSFEMLTLLPSLAIATDGIANVSVTDLTGDGTPQLLLSEPFRSQFTWIHSCSGDGDPALCTVDSITGAFTAPVRGRPIDFDNDGDIDLLVADIGRVPPTELLVGGVMLLRNHEGTYTTEVLLAGVRRIACAEPGDFDGDGLLDIVVCEFGHINGSLRLLRQNEDGEFISSQLDPRPGAIHAWPVDIDDDGDLDIVSAISQLTESILLFRNDGTGNFDLEVLFEAGDNRFGTSGCQIVDIDQDGDPDIVFSNGDTLDNDDLADVDPWEYHGVNWLENDGSGSFRLARVGSLWAAYSAVVADFDLDCDLDIIAVGLQQTEQFPDARPQSVVLFENDGAQNFTRRDLFEEPSSMISAAAIDFDRDGDIDVAVGLLPVGRATETQRAVLLRNNRITPADAVDGVRIDAATLSGTGLLSGAMRAHELAQRGFRYEVNAPLWTDGAAKLRAVLLPDDQQATVDANGDLVFPEGTVLLKSFGYTNEGNTTWIETRLLALRDGRWQPRSFLWAPDQGDATRYPAGGDIDVAGHDVPWPMPSEGECSSCHGIAAMEPLGLRVAQLNRNNPGGTNQLEALAAASFIDLSGVATPFEQLVDPDDVDADATLRARAWLEGNCAHCHQNGGTASRGGLYLDYHEDDSFALGFCRLPARGGPTLPGTTTHLIVPGNADASVLVHRSASSNPLVRMPELGTRIVDEAGVALVRDWINAMPPDDCAP